MCFLCFSSVSLSLKLDLRQGRVSQAGEEVKHCFLLVSSCICLADFSLRQFPSAFLSECYFCGFTVSGEPRLQTHKSSLARACVGVLMLVGCLFYMVYMCFNVHLGFHSTVCCCYLRTCVFMSLQPYFIDDQRWRALLSEM